MNETIQIIFLLFAYVVYTNLLYIRNYLKENNKLIESTKLYMTGLLAIFGVVCIQLQSKLILDNYFSNSWLSFILSLLLFVGYMYSVISITKKIK